MDHAARPPPAFDNPLANRAAAASELYPPLSPEREREIAEFIASDGFSDFLIRVFGEAVEKVVAAEIEEGVVI